MKKLFNYGKKCRNCNYSWKNRKIILILFNFSHKFSKEKKIFFFLSNTIKFHLKYILYQQYVHKELCDYQCRKSKTLWIVRMENAHFSGYKSQATRRISASGWEDIRKRNTCALNANVTHSTNTPQTNSWMLMHQRAK